jgi:hypothetical protein
MAFVLGFYILAFVTDVASWQLTFETIPLKPRWLGRLYLIRTVGEAFNSILKFLSLDKALDASVGPGRSCSRFVFERW